MQVDRRIVIVSEKDNIITLFLEDREAVEIRVDSIAEKHLLGSIYLGVVKDRSDCMNAAFIEIQPGKVCYYPMTELHSAIFLRQSRQGKISIGDVLIVQVSRESIKTKYPSVTTNLNISGRYLVLTSGNSRISLSTKIEGNVREELRTLLEQNRNDGIGYIIRTNAEGADRQDILSEEQRLKEIFDSVVGRAQTAKTRSLLYESIPDYVRGIQDFYGEGLTKIVADSSKVIGQIRSYLTETQPSMLDLTELYENHDVMLKDLYSVDSVLTHALQKKVWLKSGGYLVLERTETLTVIDVNTGKAESKRKSEDHFLQINLEAAREAARQIRLRNLSGIIMIDFINLKDQKDIEQVFTILSDCFNKDPIHTELVDVTPLQLFEITRKKIRRPLDECFKTASSKI